MITFSSLHLINPSPAVVIDGRLAIGEGSEPYANNVSCTLSFDTPEALHAWLENARQLVAEHIAAKEAA